jgi:hypothetical protein
MRQITLIVTLALAALGCGGLAPQEGAPGIATSTSALSIPYYYWYYDATACHAGDALAGWGLDGDTSVIKCAVMSGAYAANCYHLTSPSTVSAWPGQYINPACNWNTDVMISYDRSSGAIDCCSLSSHQFTDVAADGPGDGQYHTEWYTFPNGPTVYLHSCGPGRVLVGAEFDSDFDQYACGD